MVDVIIGGAIAAVIGAVCYGFAGLWLERRNERARQITIVTALIQEVLENRVICRYPEKEEMPELMVMTPFKLDAYYAYKGQTSFLPADAINKLIYATFLMEAVNAATQVYRSRAAAGVSVDLKSIPSLVGIDKELKFVDKELRTWREQNTHEVDESLHRL